MAIWVDSPIWTFRGVKHAHMVSDSSYSELHDFAAKLGFGQRAFQGDHYDIPDYLIPVALSLGASPIGPRELVARLRASGLRLPRNRESTPASD